jgi:hypothetical protein
MSYILQYGSGLPYTPTSTGVQGFQNLQTTFQNSSRKPTRFNVDVKLYKDFYYSKYQLSLFCNIYNLFDIKNEDYVFSDTGRANYSLTQLRTSDTPGPNTISEYFVYPTFYSAPRSVRVGMAFTF